jgi:hypothetical protein
LGCLRAKRVLFCYAQGLQTDKEVRQVHRANTVYAKQPHINAAREKTMLVRLLIRVAFDEKQIATKQFLEINETIESISKQLAAWAKSVKN